ncbi:MAG: DNA cytosine methyltransferase [Nitratireductor sp.]|uniref:DNA cytosine methyltransferase n=1 Tax=Nitratireductor sp. TaxID=1872084 RepID=UPI00261A3086|nr:DNA cytosine methyltransferase [Nitratireductor sp.]MCV0348483.1 DNA cytosine methyltransferase [Nitratireductor sp.]
MRAYYNEIDPAAAHILRALIEEGVIANGEVDTRSIKEVEPHDLEGYTQCHFFAGGGLWSVAARLAGWPDDAPLWTGSCPCQPFSAAGKGLGTDDPRHLWPDFHRLISACRPAVVMGEQVAGKAGYGWFDGVRADLAREDFTARAIDFPACSVDAPHQRNRLYWIAMDNARCYRERQSQSEICAGRHSTHHADASGVMLGDTFSSRLEGQCGHGDTGGRQKPSGPIAATDGTECRSMANSDGVGSAKIRPDVGQVCSLSKAQCWPEHHASVSGRSDAAAVDRAPASGIQPDADRGRCAGWSEGQIGFTFERTPSQRPMLRNGTYWSDAEWIACHDGKARRAQSGIRFLVDGLPGRVDLWRVGGNAIVPEAAAEVIAAFMDVYGVPVSTMRAAA